MKPFMVFDVESVGLHGEGFAVGYVVIEGGRRVESGFYRCPAKLAEGNAEDFKWISENVLPHMEEPIALTYWDGAGSKSPRDVREAFWNRWMAWKGQGAILAADCPWPVESRFLNDCIRDDPQGRAWHGPYPMIDVGSARLAVGLDPLGTEERQDDELPKHHPTADARQSARLLMEALASAAAGAKGGG